MQNEQPLLLGVNIDHVATLRQARGTRYPDPIKAAIHAEEAGADGITLHLREDRRHIQERDVEMLKEVMLTRMNLEMAVTPAMLNFSERILPESCCFVPERREELTTEGGLDVASHQDTIQDACNRLHQVGIKVSLFINPDPRQIDAAIACGAKIIEIHTGHFCDARTHDARMAELAKIENAMLLAQEAGLTVNGGHGLNFQNVRYIARMPGFHELNIGHAIVARSIFMGFRDSVREMKRLMLEARALNR